MQNLRHRAVPRTELGNRKIGYPSSSSSLKADNLVGLLEEIRARFCPTNPLRSSESVFAKQRQPPDRRHLWQRMYDPLSARNHRPLDERPTEKETRVFVSYVHTQLRPVCCPERFCWD